MERESEFLWSAQGKRVAGAAGERVAQVLAVILMSTSLSVLTSLWFTTNYKDINANGKFIDP